MEDEDLRLNLVAPDDQLGDGPVPQWPPPGVLLVDALFGVNVDLLARATMAHPDDAAATGIFGLDFDALSLQPASFRNADEAAAHAHAAVPAHAVPTAEASLPAGEARAARPLHRLQPACVCCLRVVETHPGVRILWQVPLRPAPVMNARKAHRCVSAADPPTPDVRVQPCGHWVDGLLCIQPDSSTTPILYST